MIYKKYGLLIICIVITVLFGGCGKPSGTPEDVAKSYYQNCIDGNFGGAYDLLPEVVQKQLSKNEFIEWKTIDLKSSRLKEFKVTTVQEMRDFKLEDVVYPYVVEVGIAETHIDFSQDKKEFPVSSKAYVVSENGQWKYYRSGNMKLGLSVAYNRIGWMALYGKGTEKNYNEAIINLKRASQIKDDWEVPLYFLAIAYKDIRRLDEAETTAIKAIEKAGDNKDSKSNCENLLGTIYDSKGMYAEARRHYQQALTLNPDNEYARNNLR